MNCIQILGIYITTFSSIFVISYWLVFPSMEKSSGSKIVVSSRKILNMCNINKIFTSIAVKSSFLTGM